MNYIGIDLGTSAVKLLLMDEKGTILNTITKEYPLYFPKPNWSEQNPADWWNATFNGIKELIADTDKSSIAGIGVGGQMHGLVLLDENDEVVRPAILWNDGRTEKEVEYLNSVVGRDKLVDYTANVAFAGFTAPKLLWMKDKEPDLFVKISKIMLPKDYINYMLTGIHSTDYSDASGMLLLDVKNKRYSQEMLEICSVHEEQLPVLFESYDVIGTTKISVASELGISDAVKVVAGAGDNAAAAIGTNTVNEGQCNISLGTSGTVFVPTDNYVNPANPALHSFCHANGKYHLMGCILSAASSNKWLVETVFDTDDYCKITPEIKADNELYFMPYLSGERCPHNDSDVRGAFIGLSHSSSREDIQLALFEGVSFAIRDCLELVDTKIEKATVCGGGTKSKIWMQVLANIIDKEISIINNEGPALGGAILAAKSCGTDIDIKNDIKYTVKPDKTISDVYNRKYNKFKKLYPLLKNFYKEEI